MKKVLFFLFVILATACLFSCATAPESETTPENEDNEVPVVEQSEEQGKEPIEAKILPPSEMVAPSDNPEAALAYSNGTTLMYAGRYEEAEPYFRKAIQLDPEFIDAYDHLGLTLRHLGRPEEAIVILKQSISLMPENIVPYSSLCLSYRDIGEYQNALDTANTAIMNIPDNPEGYYQAGELLYMFGYYEQTIGYIAKAAQLYLEQDSDLIYDATFILGLSYYKLNDFANAETYLGFTLQGYPDDETVQTYYVSAVLNNQAQ